MLYYSLEVLSNIDLQHLIETLEAQLDGQLAKVIVQPVFGNLICLHDTSLHGDRIFVVLQGASQQSSILAKAGNALSVCMKVSEAVGNLDCLFLP